MTCTVFWPILVEFLDVCFAVVVRVDLSDGLEELGETPFQLAAACFLASVPSVGGMLLDNETEASTQSATKEERRVRHD